MRKAKIVNLEKTDLLERLKRIAPRIEQDESYHSSYRHYIAMAERKETITIDELVRWAGLAYSWMPTTITILHSELELSLDYVNKIVDEKVKLSVDDFKKAAKFLGGSYIGLSKVLHFIEPKKFPIYDTAIYCFIYKHDKRPAYSTVNRADRLVAYYEDALKLVADEEIIDFVVKDVGNAIKDKYGYEISNMRAIEVAMFSRSPIREYSL